MTQQVANSSSINNSVRCAHHFANSKRCRLYVTALIPLTAPPRPAPQNQQDSLKPPPSSPPTSGNSARHPINEFLARLLLLLAENKISARRAAVSLYH